VHSYFSPYGIPYDASVTYFSVLSDLHYRLKRKAHLADSPFRFAIGVDQFTGEMVWSLAGLKNILKTVSLESLEYHNSRGDLVLWAATSLADADLSERISKSKRLKGERLRHSLMKAVDCTLSEGK
jgi:alpha-amylase